MLNAKLKKFILFIIIIIVLFINIRWPWFFVKLRITWLNNNQEVVSLPFVFHHSFSISYINSIYLAPVIEKYELKNGRIYLQEICTKSWGVIEYYNISDADIVKKENGEICIRNIYYHQQHITIIIGYIGKQELIWEDQFYSLYNIVGPGERVKIESITISAMEYLYEKIKPNL